MIVGLLAVAALGGAGLLGYEPRRADPLLELRLFRSVPFSSAIVMALFALCGFGAFLFVTTQYLQDVRGLPPVTAGLCLLPVGLPVLMVAPLTGPRSIADPAPSRSRGRSRQTVWTLRRNAGAVAITGDMGAGRSKGASRQGERLWRSGREVGEPAVDMRCERPGIVTSA